MAPKDPMAPFHNPFGALAGTLGPLPEGPRAPEPRAPKGPARAVVRLERKGRRGKEVTLVAELGLPARELERWLTDLKKRLGCGGQLEGGTLVLQGDLRERLPPLLEARGVRRISVS